MGLDNPLHLAFLVLLLLLVFGAKRLPEMGRSLGAGMRGFRDSISGEAGAHSSLTAPGDTPVSQLTAQSTDVQGDIEPSETSREPAATALH
jgi:sec-independent protein translocase protein TatA